MEKREERIGGGAANLEQNPLREIRVLSRLQASDTNPTQTASLVVLTLRHRYDESSIPPIFLLVAKDRDKEQREKEREKKKNGGKASALSP